MNSPTSRCCKKCAHKKRVCWVNHFTHKMKEGCFENICLEQSCSCHSTPSLQEGWECKGFDDWKDSYKGKLWSTAVQKCFEAPFIEVAMQHLLHRIDQQHKAELLAQKQRMIERIEGLSGGACTKGLCGHRNIDANSEDHGKYIGQDIGLEAAIEAVEGIE